MVVAELLADRVNVAEFVILKHVVSYLVNILVPVVVVCTQEDIRVEAEVRGGGGRCRWCTGDRGRRSPRR